MAIGHAHHAGSVDGAPKVEVGATTIMLSPGDVDSVNEAIALCVVMK